MLKLLAVCVLCEIIHCLNAIHSCKEQNKKLEEETEFAMRNEKKNSLKDKCSIG